MQKKEKKTVQPSFSNRKKIKKKSKMNEPLKPKMVSKRKANIIIWALTLILPVLVVIGTIRTFGVLGQVDSLRSEVEGMRAIERNETQGTNNLDITMITHVLDAFVPTFMNLDMTNRQGLEEREYELLKFANFDIGEIPTGTGRDLRRTLLYYDLISVRDNATHFLASYRVDYQIQRQVNEILDEAIDEETHGLEEISSIVLNIAFVIENGMLTIVSMPYFTNEVQMISGEANFDFAIVDDTSVEMRTRRESISNFLPTFFEMYARSDEAELSLFMRDPILMGGRFHLDAVDIVNASFNEVGRNMMVQVSVTFYDVDTDFFHTVPFTLILEEQTNSWFVLEMHHLFIN